jgi:shikimate dehydrogenase
MAGLNIEYDVRDICNGDFEDEVASIKLSNEILALNVTIPFKERILPYLQKLDDIARISGAVNTVKIRKSGERAMEGFNTDVYGVAASLAKLGFAGRRKGRSAVVLGAGGAARGCLFAILKNGFDSVKILNRTDRRSSKLVSDFGIRFSEKDLKSFPLTKDAFEDAVASRPNLMINTVPTGALFPFEIDLDTASRQMKLLDVNYKSISPVLKAAKKRGLVSIDGVLMLVEQAARSFEIWTGISAPRNTMMLEVRRQLKAYSQKYPG